MVWLEPWYPIADQPARVASCNELQRECASGHPLFGIPVDAIGCRCDCDDVLFSLLDGTGRVAVVHLTYTHSPPDRLPWPTTSFYDGLEQWTVNGMTPEHKEYAAES